MDIYQVSELTNQDYYPTTSDADDGGIKAIGVQTHSSQDFAALKDPALKIDFGIQVDKQKFPKKENFKLKTNLSNYENIDEINLHRRNFKGKNNNSSQTQKISIGKYGNLASKSLNTKDLKFDAMSLFKQNFLPVSKHLMSKYESLKKMFFQKFESRGMPKSPPIENNVWHENKQSSSNDHVSIILPSIPNTNEFTHNQIIVSREPIHSLILRKEKSYRDLPYFSDSVIANDNNDSLSGGKGVKSKQIRTVFNPIFHAGHMSKENIIAYSNRKNSGKLLKKQAKRPNHEKSLSETPDHKDLISGSVIVKGSSSPNQKSPSASNMPLHDPLKAVFSYKPPKNYNVSKLKPPCTKVNMIICKIGQRFKNEKVMFDL